MRAPSPSSTSSNPGSTLVPPGATRARISLTASTASRSASTESSSQRPTGAWSRSSRTLRSPAELLPGITCRPSPVGGLLLASDAAEEAARLADDLAGGRGICLERLALGPREPGRHHDIDDDVQVAALAGPSQVRNPLSPQPDLGPGLRARLHLDDLLAFDRGHDDRRAEGRLRQADGGLVDELRALALERLVLRDVHRHVQGARRPAARSRLALVREPDLVALVDARRDADLEGSPALDAALAPARLARGLDDLAVALAAGAGGHVDHLAEHRLPNAAHLAAPVALGAGDRLGPRLRAAPGAGLAACQHRDLDFLLRPEHGLLEGDAQVVAKVGAGCGPSAPPGATRGRAEERVEDVGEAAEAGAGSPLRPGRPEQVIALPALGVGEDLVGLADRLEPARRLGILAHVRVPALREAPVCLLDLRVGRATL